MYACESFFLICDFFCRLGSICWCCDLLSCPLLHIVHGDRRRRGAGSLGHCRTQDGVVTQKHVCDHACLKEQYFSRAAGVAEQLSDNDGSSLGFVVSSCVGRVPNQRFSGGQGSKRCASEALSVIRAGKRGYEICGSVDYLTQCVVCGMKVCNRDRFWCAL